ncbi:MAG: bifunctional transaldolase/phosoglucose isomerase [Anaerolineae bacterium]|nr:bifunctional transaldolase/phosoglucose isomerase [Anaerolineae bacterium]
MGKIQEIRALGQSIWYDNIRRSLLTSGEIKALIDKGVTGMTSNPTIFEKAIAGSADYDESIAVLTRAGKSVDETFEGLAIEDIRSAADLLAPIYEETNGADGYISLEVSPRLAHNTAGTVRDARRLFKTVARPNLMIKVPATPEGIPAIQTLIADGININVTLIFSLQAYEAVMDAYLSGLEQLIAAGGDPSHVASVASFFVSRVDTMVDKELEQLERPDLQGKAAIANAKLAYQLFRQVFSGPRWDALAEKGARYQRPLWASTSTKNPNYPELLYVDALIGPDTVNTVPPATVKALDENAQVAVTIDEGIDAAQAHLEALAALGIDMTAVTDRLLAEGVTSFSKSFDDLMLSIARKRGKLIAESQGRSAWLGAHQDAVDKALAALDANDIPARIWLKDHTVWRNDPAEVANRLGWLDSPLNMVKHLPTIADFADEALADGYVAAIVLGMGGSSLAPELFARTFGVSTAFMEVVVLDSTDADRVGEIAARFDPARTLYIVSSKSGGTAETSSFFKFFYNRVVEAVGEAEAGQHFIAITDPGSGLVDLGEKYHFRHVFLNDSNIGGRYSALTFFGLVPAALDGTNVSLLLTRGAQMADWCGPALSAFDNAGAWLGAILGALAAAGKDKLTFFISHSIASFGDWVEQLIAESTGKDGKGILPVVGEPVARVDTYGDDRVFVYLQTAGDSTYDSAMYDLIKQGRPVIWLRLKDTYDVGAQFFLWEYAVAVAGRVMGIQPFDQPNVESAKVQARKMIAAYKESGAFPAQTAALTDGGITVYGNVQAANAGEALLRFFDAAQDGDYIALQAYVNPTKEVDEALQDLRLKLRNVSRLATTVGYGPRFLHSTGQLHKGDRGNGLFVILTSDAAHDLPIPDEAGAPDAALTFNALKTAQALGDQQALLDVGRRVIRFHLGADVVAGIRRLTDAVRDPRLTGGRRGLFAAES